MRESLPDRERPAGRAGSTRRVLTAGALLVGMVALASLRLDGIPPTPPEIAIAATSTDEPRRTTASRGSGDDCLAPVFIEPDGEPVPDGATMRLNSNTFRRVFVCEPSLLTLRAEGSAVDGVGARLVVGWRDQTLFDQPIEGAIDVEVEVPGAGWVVLAFANDLYRPPLDRNLAVLDARLTPLRETAP